MAPLRKFVALSVLLIFTLACGLIAAPATPTASPQASPTPASSDTPAFTPTIPATDTPASTDTPSPSDTPNPLSQLMPAPFTNLMGGISQFFNPVGQPVQTWNGIPIMPQAAAGQEFKPGEIYSFKAAATVAQGESFYQAKISALGFSLNGGPATGSAGTGSNAQHNSFLYFYKGSRILLISITSFDSDPNTIIVVISTQ